MDEKQPVIKAAGLSKIYSGQTQVTALDRADLTIFSGEFVGIMGRSGSGKSTLLSLLGLLELPSKGTLEIAGKPIAGLTRRQITRLRADTLGFIFQTFNLVGELTSMANVELGFRYQKGKIENKKDLCIASLEQVGLEHRINAKVNTLSGGEQQRVAIARALVKKPQIILADEPTGNLDSENEISVIQILADIAANGTTVIVATHSQTVAKTCGRIIELNDGKIVSQTDQSGGIEK